MPKKNKKLALDSGIQTNQILTNYGEVCIPRLSSILLSLSLQVVVLVKDPVHIQGKQNSYIGQYLVVSVTRLQLPAGLVTLTTNYHSTYHPI